jgi:hypothetical protein
MDFRICHRAIPMGIGGRLITPKELLLVNKARKHGIVNPLIAYQEAKRAGLSFPVACAVLMQESGGGHNIFGHDPTIYAGAGTVTKAKYLAYKKQRGTTHMQGVGPMQLTWYSYQDRADRYGGCWNVRYNMRVAFELLANYIKKHGEWEALKLYNGSASYADQVSSRVKEWKGYLK